jgi:hypothetical protein
LTRLVMNICRGRSVPVGTPITPTTTPLALPAPPVLLPLEPPVSTPPALPTPEVTPLSGSLPPSTPNPSSPKNKSLVWTSVRSWIENEVLIYIYPMEI